MSVFPTVLLYLKMQNVQMLNIHLPIVRHTLFSLVLYMHLKVETFFKKGIPFKKIIFYL